MAKQSNSNLQKVLVEQILRAEQRREDWSNDMRVDLARAYYRGQQNPGFPPEEWISINKIYSHMQSQLAALYSVDPYFYVKLKRSHTPDPNQIAAFEEKGKARSAYLNYLKGELKLKGKARLAIQDSFFAYGVLRVDFEAEEVENPDAGSVITDEEGKELMINDEPLREPDVLLANEKYIVRRVHPDDFFWDYDSGPLEEDWHWVAERIRLTKSQVKNSKFMKQSVLDGITTCKKDKDDDKSIEVYELFKIYDLQNKTWTIIHKDARVPVMNPRPIPLGIEGHPYSILRYTLQDDTPYPITPLSVVVDPQKEYSMIRSLLLTHRKRFNRRKYEMYGPAFDDPDVTASQLEHGEDGTVLIKNAPGRAIDPIQDAPLDQGNYIDAQSLNADITELMGSSDEAVGISGADSATQAALIDKRLGLKEGDRQSIVIDWLNDMAKKLDQLVQVNVTRDEAVKILGPNGDELWQLVKSTDYDEIQGEYAYEIATGSTLPNLPQVERTQFIAFLGMIGQAPHLMLSRRLMMRAAEMFGIEDESLVDELIQIAKTQQAQQGQGGGVGGGPASAVAGEALGQLGGNANGGGAASLQQA